MNDDYLLSGRLFCGHCGSPMTAQAGTSSTGRKFSYYACNRRRYQHACDKKPVPKETIEKVVIDYILKDLMNDDLIEWIVQSYDAAVNKIKDDARQQILQAELKEVNDKLSNIMKAIEAGIFNEMTQERMEELYATRKDLEQAIRLEEKANDIPGPDAVRSWLHNLRSGDIEDRLYQRQLILTFIRAIYVYDDTVRIFFNYGTEHDVGTQESQELLGSSAFTTSPELGTTSVLRELFFTKEFFEVLLPLRW